ncbi:MAG: PHP domain-containing protein [Desulfobacterales bacterium]|nr:MAG: PHP domain-containing protein [Desulfobacterales bacterium]
MDYNHHLGIDLHIHSTASDGSLTPSEILHQAQKLNLAAIAITDHDSIEGSKSAIRTGISSSIKFLTGVEISAAYPSFFPGSGSFHILGYCIRLNDTVLNQTLDKLQRARKSRNPEIIKRLNKLGLPISLEEVREEAAQGQLGRPHIARAMVNKGFVQSIDEAFDTFLATGKPAYVDKYRIQCAEAIAIILGAGGIPVLAHPGLLSTTREEDIDNLIVNLKRIGIQGIEVYYPQHTHQQMNYYADLAERHDLRITGGTDFHGAIMPKIKMGSGNGNLFIPYELYEKLIDS